MSPKWTEEWASVRKDQSLLAGPLTLDDARKFYYDHSRSLSTVARQLAFAGIATVWIFKVTSNGSPSIPDRLHWPIILFVAVLGADLLQYTCAALSWGLFEVLMERKFQKEGRDETAERFGAPNSTNWLGNLFLILKVLLLLIAYVWLFASLYRIIFS